MPAEISGFFYESFENLFDKFYSLIDADMKKWENFWQKLFDTVFRGTLAISH